MNRDSLQDALGCISDKHLAEAATPPRRRYLPYIGAAAACLAVVIGLFLFQPEPSGNPPTMQNNPLPPVSTPTAPPTNAPMLPTEGLLEEDTTPTADAQVPNKHAPSTGTESLYPPDSPPPETPGSHETDPEETDPDETEETAPEDTEPSEPAATDTKNRQAGRHYGLVINGKAIATSVIFNHSYCYAELPLITISEELGATVTWQNSTLVHIMLRGTTYQLHTDKGTLTKEGNSVNILSVAPGSGHGTFYRTAGNEFFIDSDSATAFITYIIGAKITIDFDNNLVTIG